MLSSNWLKALFQFLFLINILRTNCGQSYSCECKVVDRYLTLMIALFQWSFGVTCWEVFSGGRTPYPGIHPVGLIDLLESGRRLSKPTNAACSGIM